MKFIKWLLVVLFVCYFVRALSAADQLQQQEADLWNKVELSLLKLEQDRNSLEKSVSILKMQLQTSNEISQTQVIALQQLDSQLQITERSHENLLTSYNELKLKSQTQSKVIAIFAFIGVVMLVLKSILIYLMFVSKIKLPRLLEIIL